MKLDALLSSVDVVSRSGSGDVEISSLSEDSRRVETGALFFARQGSKVSGLDFIREALQKGAAAVITDGETGELPVPVVRVRSVAEVQPRLAAEFYGHPSRELTVIGVTGTNGKTTFTYLMENIVRQKGWRPGVIGTISYRVPSEGSEAMELQPAPNTTPNALELQKMFRLFSARKTDVVLMEVSSHALALDRTGGVEFDGAVFTNLTQDHLDFHKSMEDYFEAKARLFITLSARKKQKSRGPFQPAGPDKFCIINRDDAYGRKLAERASVPAVTYGVEAGADVTAADVELDAGGGRFVLKAFGRSAKVRLPLIGLHNVYNALAAAACSLRMGIPLETVVSGLEKTEGVPGRLERVDAGQDFTVVVDYAHTEDALRNVLSALKQLAPGRVLTLFGCGGDRDRSKRPLMGRTASELSDWVVITSDNPRSEDPQKIALDIEVGVHREGRQNYEVILDREAAIEKIIGMAQKGDMVLLAGKGHETYQIFADRTVHFDDRETAEKFLRRK